MKGFGKKDQNYTLPAAQKPVCENAGDLNDI